ncbi:DUF4112 domain-containing protein [Aetokthonos hydrillicola Thurmond2011]|jgi:hypothetical protein|uniref:DUF4112 domain-containing protein n=1 Tax=Aetokthonos hydrillicola Thurmond2011 TaxID=2712845 RepID=A0AAP5M8K3_9CYAN|nr:DUF4112 domain-containing protein [Aetokthonos hydrillicola]MBO3458164.1 DUF4112 domain-containing protein [Aetokthonos hydrillicola CCALA 1050]MBW4584384.1 DUF4112 domain-containing protein [Aetokthonos hydrillicola CCALA 1050]MDR9896345.1 DUF4112 domain-containing protein [Aetokthonos hydrillicola Thurmond2011]
MSQPRHQFPTIEPDSKAATLMRLREMSRMLDRVITIPIIKLPVGLDPIMGIIPVGGDFLGFLLSAYIVFEAARLGVSASTLSRMALNIIIDGLIGAIPVFGDLFDFAWTANQYNIKLLEEHLKSPRRRKSADGWFVLIVLGGLSVFAIGLVAFVVLVIKLLIGALTGS